GDREAARRLATDLEASDDPALRDRARLLLQSADAPPVDRDKIGVLLPLTGKYASVAEQVRAALVDGWSQVVSGHDLLFTDTGGTADGAVAALDGLVRDQHVIAVIGPLLSDETAAVIDEASALAVPLVTLSQAWEGDADHPWVFQGWLTPGQQIDALLDVAMGERNMHDFAVYAPTSSYGTHAADLFVERVTARGGHVVTRADYPEDTKAHGDYVTKLRGADTPRGQRWFDAVFVPDNANRVVLAAASMAYAEISIGDFRAQGREPVPLLGLSGWNRPEIVINGGANTRGGLFTDVYVPPPTGGQVWFSLAAWREFTTRYQEGTGRTPSAIEALASDAGRVVGTVFRSSPTDRYDFRNALLAVRPTGTISEATGFDPATRTLTRRVAVIEVRAEGLRPLGYE
ncbi:MAG TPA: penicillin-binding protein activator, partial [Myxococcota bacterium]|nr:penicillin-binding protein activator [Myxococcota bacterium]